MGIFDKLFKKENVSTYSDSNVVAVCDGELIPAEKIADPVFSQNLMGKTIAIEPTSGTITSPVNGKLEVLFPTGHAFAVRAKNGTGYLIHIGIDTVSMNGDGFKTLKKQGDTVKAGEPIVEVNFNKVEDANHPKTTMIIITEPVDGMTYDYIDFGTVRSNQIISKQ